jgi:hypothetical protein
VGPNYEDRHTVSFEEAALLGGPLATQMVLRREAFEPSLEDMERAARYMVEGAVAVAARPRHAPLRLPSESAEEESSEESSEEEEVEMMELGLEEGEVSSSSSSTEEEGEMVVPSAVVVVVHNSSDDEA